MSELRQILKDFGNTIVNSPKLFTVNYDGILEVSEEYLDQVEAEIVEMIEIAEIEAQQLGLTKARYGQYLICKERGHKPDPLRGGITNAVYGAPTQYVCKYCGTTFWTTTKTTEHEANAPDPLKELTQ